MTEQIKEKRGVSRRSFLKGAGAVAGAAVIGLPLVKNALAQPWQLPTTLPKETMLEMYKRMQRLRIGGVKGAAAKTNVGGLDGEEAAHVGVCMALNKGDYITSTHNCVGEIVAVGADLKRFYAECQGKVTGFSRGHAGRWMAVYDPESGIFVDGSPMVSHGPPHAVGAAKGFKLRGVPQVAVSVHGDGAMNGAGFNSSLNLAVIWNVPVVFVVVNNHWENMGGIVEAQALTKAGLNLSVRAAGYGIPGITVDGMDVFAVYLAAKHCIDRARAGGGTSLLEADTYSYSKGANVAKWPFYREGELEYWKARDPIQRFESTVLTGGFLTQQDLDAVVQQVNAEVDEALTFAKESANPDPAEELKYAREVLGA